MWPLYIFDPCYVNPEAQNCDNGLRIIVTTFNIRLKESKHINIQIKYLVCR